MRAMLMVLIVAGTAAGPCMGQAPATPSPETVTVSIPIFSQVVVFKIPKGWKPAHENKAPGHYLLEHIPSDQTLENWKERVTVQGFQGRGK